ncbi:MAG: class I SAM-dependent methyltransferase [Halodesulfurarchaeum sp.]
MTGESPPPIRAVYDRIGPHFSKTRRHPWTDVTDFLGTVEGTVGLDVGCGNGRHTEAMAAAVDRPIGLDLSGTLIREARSRIRSAGVEATFLQGSATAIPVGSSTVDVGLYIATIHHLRDRDVRVQSLDELARVLRPAGTALISSWCTTHETFDRDSGFDTTVDWTLPGGETVPRFYHIYDPAEFDTDLRASRLDLEGTWTSRGNCYARVRGRR